MKTASPTGATLLVLALAGLPAGVLAQTTPGASLAYRTFQSLVISRWCATGAGDCGAGTGADQIAMLTDPARLVGVQRLGDLRVSPSTVQNVYSAIDPSLRDSLERVLVDAKLVTASGVGLGTGPLGATVVSGLTEFLLQRARDEVVQSVFRDLSALFAGNPDLATLFPNMRAAVDAAADLPLRTLLPALRAAGEEDLRTLPVAIADPRLTFWDGGVPWEVQAISLVSQRALDVMRGVPFEESAATLADLSSDQLGQDEVRTAFRLLGVLAREGPALQLATNADPNFAEWVGLISARPLHRLLADPATRRVFVTLLLHDLDADELRHLADEGNDTIDRILGAYQRIRNIEALVQQARGGATPLDVLQAVSGAFEEARALILTNARPQAEQALAAARALLRAFQRGDHGHLLLVLSNAIPKRDGPPGEGPGKVKRIVALATALADASSSEAVTQALEAWADPVGSFRERRRKGAVQVSVVSYVGLAGGMEWVQDAAPDVNVRGGFSGMHVPVGLELSFGLGDASVGFMASMLNVGTLASLRLGGLDATTATDTLAVANEPQVGLEQVFAPGGWVTFGLTGSYPLALGFGVEYAPRLRTVEGGGGAVERSALRAAAFIGIDLTLFRF